MMQVVDELNEAMIELSFRIQIISTVIIDRILTLIQFHEFFIKIDIICFCFYYHWQFVKM